MSIYKFTLLSFVAIILSCSPKTPVVDSTPEQPTPPPPPVVQKGLSTCKKFSDSDNMEGAKTAHVLYRDFLKQKSYDEAFTYWEKAYEMAPAADGLRDYHFLDGIKLYEYKITQTQDQEKIKEYQNRIMEFYDEATDCYPKNANLYKGLKAFKLYYNFPELASDMDKYKMFREVIDSENEKTSDFIINPFTALMMDLYLSEKIQIDEARKYAFEIMEIVDYGTKNCKNTRECERWDIVKSYAPARLESLEGVEGFYDCDYYKSKYYNAFLEAEEDCEAVANVYGRLKWGKCPETDESLKSLLPKMAKCFPPAQNTSAPLCSDLLRNGDYSGALTCYEEKANNSSDSEKRAQYYLIMAKINYGQLKKYSTARKYARLALNEKPGWGEPSLLIGKLYASSGPLCGPGRGFDSQRVTWVAIDEWNKAKKDSETRAEAQRLINKYAQYMPSIEDLHQRSMKVGDSYKVPCWIQQTTTIRPAP